ncbi:hypothetical protein IMZ48_13685 [Candidatus Bathyarchaeota archaeon]|nr:hypothetical protein [Candidatus Bathyarchaeota archaeon]
MSPVPQTPKGGLATAEYEWDSESVYSRDDKAEPRVGPLRIPPREDDSIEPIMGDNPVLHGYCAWKQPSPQLENIANPPALEHFNPEFPSNNLEAGKTESKHTRQQRDALYSPLTPFFADKSGAAEKKGSKIMFGQNGWLEKTGKTPEKKKITQKKSIFGGLRKMAKDLVSLIPGPATRRGFPSARYWAILTCIFLDDLQPPSACRGKALGPVFEHFHLTRPPRAEPPVLRA